MRIGFDVAQTCVEKAGCGWYADALVRAMAEVAPEHQYILYHHFDGWINASTRAGTSLGPAGAEEPLKMLGVTEATALWADVREGKPLPGRPRIVHANCFQAPKIPQAKLVFTVYDVSFWTVPEFTTEENRLTCQEGTLRALRNADGFVFISESSRNEFGRVLPGWLEDSGKPWAITPLGPKDLAYGAAPLASRDYWLAVGSLEPRKNYEALLDAMESYWGKSQTRFPLKIAGGKGWNSGALLRRINSLQERGLVSYLGYVPDRQLAALYGGAVGLLFPSWYEGFGLPLIEAMNAGCPVISSGRASLREVGGDACIYIDPASPGSIAEALLHLEGDPALQRYLSRTGLARASKFTWEDTARRTLDLYDRVLSGSPALPC